MEHRQSTRALTEGALMAGLAVIFALLGMLPLLGAVSILISGIPITVATAKYGGFTGILSAILATILIALFLGPISALSYGLENMLLGFVIGILLYKRKSAIKIWQAGVCTAALASFVLLFISFAIMGFTPDTIAAYYNEMEHSMMEMYESTGLLDAMLQQQQDIGAIEFTAMLESMISVIVQLSPAMILLGGGVNGALTCWITLLVLKRLKVRIPRAFQFSNWRLPFVFIWPIIVVWAIWLMGDRINVDWLNILVMNAMVVCAALLFLNGVTAAMHIFHYKEMSTAMKVLTVLMFFLFFTGMLIGLIILGIADLLFDFRKKKVDNSKGI